MKLAHISDLHLGKFFHDFNILEDQEYILEQIARICIERKIEVLMNVMLINLYRLSRF